MPASPWSDTAKLLPLLHVSTTAAYAGFQLLVQGVVYRSFPLVPAADFPAYVAAHQRRIAYVVAPLFGGMLATTGGLLLARPPGVPQPALAGTAGLLAAVLALTGAGAVPEHRRLAVGYDDAAWRRLLRVDAARTAAGLGNAALAVAIGVLAN